jgi:type I restriction enzyme S subunit
MPKNWKIYKLEEVAQLRKEGIKPSDFNGEDYIGLEHIGQGDFLLDGIGKASDVKSNKSKFVEGDILYGKIRPYFKKVYRPKFSGICSTDILIINTKNENLVSQSYLHHLIKTQEFTDKATETSSGTKMPRADWKSLEKWGISFPPLPEQTQIANILSAIDDKIENNLAINKTLEDMAMAFYKHWFVDFGPFQEGEFIDSELGLIPKGWEVKIIGNVIDTLGGGTPKTTENSYWENGDILWYSPTDLTRDNAMFSLDSSKRINNLGLLKSSAKLFPPYSLLMSSRATIGALTINTIKASTNQGFITMIPNDNMSVYQLYSWTKWNMDLIISKSNGSTFKEISKANFRSLEIVVGQNIELFLRESKNIFDKVENNIQENQTLTKLRDTLLPKLISGEVRLKEFREGIDAEINSA